MVGQFFAGKFVHLVSNASIADLSAPSFSGISSATVNPNGSITVGWSTATDSSSPVRYIAYVALGSVSAAALFVPANSVLIAPYAATSIKVYTLADQTTYLQPSQIYTFGVRVSDAVGNTDTNTAIATATSSGVLSDSLSSTVSQLVATQLLLATDHANFATDHTNFQTDHTNFQTDHTNLAADVTKLDGYVSALDTTATGLATTATNLATTETNLATDHTNLAADVTNLDGYISTLNTSITNVDSAATNVNNAANLTMSVVL